VISATENSNKFQKTRFWKENSVEDMITVGPAAAQATLVSIYKRGSDFFYRFSPSSSFFSSLCSFSSCTYFN
jgi:hypothetical protein